MQCTSKFHGFYALPSIAFQPTNNKSSKKIIHGWLPLQPWPQVTSTSHNKLCPSCKRQPKGMAHFLSCTHPSSPSTPIATSKTASETQHQPKLYQLLWQGITSVLFSHELINPHERYQDIDLQINQTQECIGWAQNCWVHTIKAQAINSTNFYAKITQLCWQYVIMIWTECNWALHNTADPYDTSHLWATVQQIFHDAAQTSQYQSTIWDQTVDSIMNHPICQNTVWIDYGAIHLWDHAKNPYPGHLVFLQPKNCIQI